MNATVRAFLHYSLGPVAYQYEGLTPEEQALCTPEEFQEMVRELGSYQTWLVAEVRRNGRWEAWSTYSRNELLHGQQLRARERVTIARNAGVSLVDVRVRLATPAEEAAIEAGQV